MLLTKSGKDGIESKEIVSTKKSWKWKLYTKCIETTYMFFKYCGFWIFFEEKPASSTKSTKHLKLFDPLLSTAPAAKVRWFSPRSPHRQGGNDSSGVSRFTRKIGTFWDHCDVFFWCQVHSVLPPVRDWFDVNVLGTCAHVEWYATDGVRWGCSGWGGISTFCELARHVECYAQPMGLGWGGVGREGEDVNVNIPWTCEAVLFSETLQSAYKDAFEARGAEWAKKVKVNVCTKFAGTQLDCTWMWLNRHVPTCLKNTSFDTINKRLEDYIDRFVHGYNK